MRLPGGIAIWLVAAVLLGPSLALAMERIEVPIKQTVLTDGEIRYSIPVSIGGSKPIDAMLDTGSTGLRILPGTLPDSAYTATDQPSVYGYGSGVRLNGVTANAVVTIGGAASLAPIPFQLVRSVDCFPTLPHCPASRISQQDYRIGGDGLPRQGFRAIIGTNTGAGQGADVVNPIGRLGTHAWIVTLPKPGDRNPGKLIINPGPADRAGYVTLPTDEILRKMQGAGAFHDAVLGCLVFEKTQKRVCGPTILDSGAPGMSIGASDQGSLGGWSQGDPVALVFKDGRGGEATARFTAGADRASRISAKLSPNQPRNRISSGSLPYFHLSVLYDDEQHVIGFKPRLVNAEAESSPETLGRIIDQAVARVPPCVGLAIGATRGNVRAQRFHGDTGNHGPPKAETIFGIGSITKTLTATLLAFADQQGTMHIDDPLKRYAPPGFHVPDFNGQPIVLAHLAEHTSGLPRIVPNPSRPMPPEQLWRFIDNYQLPRAPGEQFLYSNLGYALLARAMVRRLNASEDQLYARIITGPLGLHDTTIELTPAQRARLAQGFLPNRQPAPEFGPAFPAMAGAGGLRSTLNDMMRYLDFELGRLDVPLRSLLPVLHQPRHAAGPNGSVGLGWQMRSGAHGSIIFKGGAMPGYAAYMVFVPTQGTGVVVLSNQAECAVQKIAGQIMGELSGTGGIDLPPSAKDE